MFEAIHDGRSGILPKRHKSEKFDVLDSTRTATTMAKSLKWTSSAWALSTKNLKPNLLNMQKLLKS